MPKVNITDTILRDAHQSLIATRMRTEDMLPICEKLDQIGYWSLEMWGGATFDACIRFLKEDPWERLRLLRQALPNTRLQMLLRGQNLLGYRHYSDDVVQSFVERSAENGIDVFRVFDALNDQRNIKTAIQAVKKNHKHAQGTICYTTSPVHNINKFVEMAKGLEDMACDSIAVKDMAGLLTPTVTANLFDALHQAVDIPIHLHSHATAGLASMCQLKAIEHGCRHIDTAISTFAGGTSHPSTESMVAALKDSPHNTELDLESLQDIGFYFFGVRKKYARFESEHTGVDTRVQVNQIPGGMISNLANQLKEQGALDRMNAVLTEVPKVRKELGYPPLVTPTSQIVGTQAVMNVLAEQRYKNITNEVKLYLQGKYGKAPGKIDAQIRQQAIGNEEAIDCRPADLLPPEMSTLRADIGSLAGSDEDVLIYAMFTDIGKTFLEQRAAGNLVPEPLELPDSNDGKQAPPVEFNVTMHGESYHIKVTGTGHKSQGIRPFYVSVDGIPEELMLETLEELNNDELSHKSSQGSRRPRAKSPGDVTTSMPGSIVEVLVAIDDHVNAGDALLITEAMKMETEIQAPLSGTIKAVHIAKGDTVNPDETLIEIESD